MKAATAIRGALVDRTWQTLGIAFIILAFVRAPMPDESCEPRYFDYQKLTWRGNADAVIVGDSRALVGLSPGIMSKEIEGMRIRNFAFGAAGYSADYLEAAETVLDHRSPRKMLILGITPRSLRDVSVKMNQFISCSQSMSIPACCKSRWLGWVKFVWPPLDRPTFEQIFLGREQKYAKAIRHCDGWSAPQAQHIDYSEAITTYRQWQRDPISEVITNRILSKVQDWTGRGIHVYGFRPPTCPEMEEVEDDFDELTFVKAFQDAGGVWLSPSQKDLKTFDASHLDAQSARLYSTRVAHSIEMIERKVAERPASRLDATSRRY